MCYHYSVEENVNCVLSLQCRRYSYNKALCNDLAMNNELLLDRFPRNPRMESP